MNNGTSSQATPAAEPKKPFQLLRYFSIASLLALALVAVSLVIFYRQIAVNDLINIGESKNVSLTQAFSNSIWPEFTLFFNSVKDQNAAQIRANPQTAQLSQSIHDQMQGLLVTKVKIYNLKGITIFSTDASEIGEDKSQDAGFVAVHNGGMASELTPRGKFSSFEGEIEDPLHDVISSYIPIQHAGSGIQGVFEVYGDVTSLLKNISDAQTRIAVGVTLIFALLFVLLFLLVRRADNLIKRQFVEQLQSEEKIRVAYADLDIKKRKEERVNEFFLSTLDHMGDTINHGAEKVELLVYLEQIKQQFSRLS